MRKLSESEREWALAAGASEPRFRMTIQALLVHYLIKPIHRLARLIVKTIDSAHLAVY